MRHRGPDGEGYHSDGTVYLGHRRLSIIDLDGGHQPMTNEDGTLWLVFNGEIYNYRELIPTLQASGHVFRTRCDSEVILHAYEQWGEQCVHRFNGMWAFALWDQRNRRLFLSRDRLGVKPLFYWQSSETFIFASEVKGILAASIAPSPHRAAIATYLVDGYLDCDEKTLFAGIHQLRPGHNLTYADSRLTISAYWPSREFLDACGTNESIAAEELLQLLSDSVSLRLRSDVPVGSALSGGLDSSSIVVLAHEISRRNGSPFSYQTYTASFPGYSKDETEFVRVLTAQTHCTTRYIEMNGDELRQDLATLTRCQEVPVPSGSCYAQWRVMRRAHEDGIKVLLDGQGGDEVLAGYPMFFPAAASDHLREFHPRDSFETLRAMSRYHAFTPAQVLKYFTFQFAPAGIQTELRRGLKRPDIPLHPALRETYGVKEFGIAPPFSDRLARHQWLVLRHWQLPDLLHFEDRNSMAFGIETRLPFLDYRLVEMGLRLPSRSKVRNSQGKWILRQAMREKLPNKIISRYDKIGFAAPDGDWLSGSLGNHLRELAFSPSFQQREWVDADWLRRQSQRQHAVGAGVLWRLAGLELWARVFLDN